MSSVLLVSLLLQGAVEPASFREAVALAREGRFEQAERAFLAALQELPSHAPSHVQLARLYVRSGRLAEAEEILTRGLEHHPEGIVLLNELGSLLLASGKPAEAESIFRRALMVSPSNPRSIAGLAGSLAEKGDRNGARGLVEEALRARPDSPELHFLLGTLELGAGDAAAALDSFARAKELGAGNPAALELSRGAALDRLGREDEAEMAFRSVLAMDPASIESHRRLGLLLVESRPHEALPHLKSALSRNPEDLEVLTAAGLACYALNRDREALELLASASEKDPSDGRLPVAMGKVHFRRGEWEHSRRLFERALAAADPSAEAHFYLGEIDLQALRFEEALAHYREVSSPESLRGAAEALRKLGRYEEAEASLARAFGLPQEDRTKARMHYALATLHRERGNAGAAVASAEEARDLDPHHAATRHLLGTILAQLGRREEAEKELREFQELQAFDERKQKLELALLESPDRADAYLPLIELYLEASRIREARSYLEKARALAPEDPALAELEKRLGPPESPCSR